MDPDILYFIDFWKTNLPYLLGIYPFCLVITVLLHKIIVVLAEKFALLECEAVFWVPWALVFSFGLSCVIIRIALTMSLMLFITHVFLHMPSDPSIVISLVVAIAANILLIVYIKIKKDKKAKEKAAKSKEKQF